MDHVMRAGSRCASSFAFLLSFVFFTVFLSIGGCAPARAEPLRIGYSDYPGYVAWQVAIDKNWFREAGLDVAFQWFDYGASLDAFAAGKLDAIAAAAGDVLTIGATGRKSVMILQSDYSNGNDMIIATADVHGLKDLKGRKVAVEKGLVDDFMLDYALKGVGLSESDVTLVNIKTNEAPQVLASGGVDAVSVWQPTAGQVLRLAVGARPVFTSREAPGLLCDVIAVGPESLAAHRAEWLGIMRIWERVVHYINDPATQDDALRIMSARVGVDVATYRKLLDGTRLMTLADNRRSFVDSHNIMSLYESTRLADAFNVREGVYKTAQPVSKYLDSGLLSALKE
ncbi:ABC transporter substrate-binding protein [Acetobacter papayae]|uniref:ABC transporter substrate-binding protein n=1 Tax=Acetobacter papayae TaxID=1076592 RepID=UPI0039E9F5E0